MSAWKIIGYIFVCLGTICFLYGFFVGVTETINLTTALFMDSSDSSMNSFFSLFLSAIAPWMVLASVLFTVGGVGLFLGRDKNKVKLSTYQDNIYARLEMLERTIDRNFQSVSNRLDAIEKQKKENELLTNEK